MPYHHESLAQMKALAEAPTLGNMHPDARAQALARATVADSERMQWLHSAQAVDADGYEWGIFRVKWEDGRAVDVQRTRADHTDLDSARVTGEAAAAPSVEPTTKDEFRGDTQHLIRCIEALLNLDAKGALVPHGIGGHARSLLSSAAVRLAASAPAPRADLHAAPEPIKRWYMRDNHTFRELSMDDGEALNQALAEAESDGFYGMLCATQGNSGKPCGVVHGHGRDKSAEFIAQAKEWLASAHAVAELVAGAVADPEPHADWKPGMCLPDGVRFDAFGNERVRYVRVIHDGTTCVVPPGDVESLVDSERPEDYKTADVYLSKEEFDALPEFDGF